MEQAAPPGEVYVSPTVHDMLIGGDVTFQDRGPHELKGIERARRLYACVASAGAGGGA